MPSLKRACLSPDCCCCCPVQDHPCPDAPANMLSHHIGRLNTPQTTMARPMIELGPTILITFSYVNVKFATPFASATMLPRSPRCLPCHQPCSAPCHIAPYRAADSGPPCVMFSGLKWPPALAPPELNVIIHKCCSSVTYLVSRCRTHAHAVRAHQASVPSAGHCMSPWDCQLRCSESAHNECQSIIVPCRCHMPPAGTSWSLQSCCRSPQAP